MRPIGMIGGMSWESSAIYYRMVNEAVKDRFGGHHSAQTVMYSVDFDSIKRLQHEGRWEETAASLAQAARKVEQGGLRRAVHQHHARGGGRYHGSGEHTLGAHRRRHGRRG